MLRSCLWLGDCWPFGDGMWEKEKKTVRLWRTVLCGGVYEAILFYFTFRDLPGVSLVEVLMPLMRHSSLTETPLRAAILLRVSPFLTL